MSDLKVVNPEAIMAYGRAVNNNVDAITNTLNAVCDSVVTVDYHGTNAFAFKTQAGEIASAFATNLFQRINDLKTNIAKATSNLLESLGAGGITIDLSDNTLAKVSPEPDTGIQIADTSALTGLISTLNGQFEQLNTDIKAIAKLPENDRNGWMGVARTTTEGIVHDFVASATGVASTAQADLVKFISTQIELTTAADRV